MDNKGYLNQLHTPGDVKKLNTKQLDILAGEIREKMIETISHNGGHLASNLGVVELTLAIHKVFDSPKDQIVWDVGHQTYTHKLITGRQDRFDTIRKEGGLSGFSRPYESEHDIFFSGHSSTSVSSALGLVSAKHLKNDRENVIAVIGDGSFTGGMAFEGLNNAGRSKSNLIVILNDNEMSISKNVGSFAKYLAVVRSKPGYINFKSRTEAFLRNIPFIGEYLADLAYRVKRFFKNLIYNSTMFEDMGFTYMGPVDGHNIEQLCDALESAKLKKDPVLLHVKTIKGKGYDFAERSPSIFHGVSKFDINTGEPLSRGKSFSEVFGRYMCEIAAKDRRICAITAAMALGTGLGRFSNDYPDRFFDVGIAEEHAVAFALGLSRNGMLPVFAVYSTFLQRCYDQLIHDGALQKQRMVIAVDRAGFVGEDGESHQGLFDVAFLNTIPDITVYSPSTFSELKSCCNIAFYHSNNITAVRYPRGSEKKLPADFKPSFGNYDLYGSKTAETVIITYGRIFSESCQAMQALKEQGVDVLLLKLNRIKPIDESCLPKIKHAKHIFFFEEGIKSGGAGEKFGNLLLAGTYKGDYHIIAVNDCFVAQASVSAQLKRFHLDAEGMVKEVSQYFE